MMIRFYPAPARTLVATVVFVSFGLLTSSARAQSAVWSPQGATTGNIYYNGGNVGIGTPSPSAPLSIASPTAGIRVNSWLDVTSSACGLGSIGQNVYLNWSDNTYRWANSHGSLGGSAIQLGVCNASTWNDIVFLRAAGTTGNIPTAAGSAAGMFESMRIASNGNVGISTSNPQYLLSVNGQIGAKDIIVTNTGWSDYVFRPGFRLRPLSEVAAYIHAYHHLPDIPSEAEVKEKGVSVADMQSKLLAKIEELTLHMIQADERNNRLEKQNQELRQRIERMEAAATR
jgi:hypothetical protein